MIIGLDEMSQHFRVSLRFELVACFQQAFLQDLFATVKQQVDAGKALAAAAKVLPTTLLDYLVPPQ